MATVEQRMKVTWPQVTLILGTMFLFFTTVVILTKFGVNAEAVMTTCVLLLLTVLGVLGYKSQGQIQEKVDQVKELSNGRITSLEEKNDRLQQQVTDMALKMQPPK